MQWEQLTAPDFAKAVEETGVCVIGMGVLEKHGDHLPLGTDYLNGHAIASLAAEKEAAVVFPPFYFGQIYEARCFPGAVCLKPTLLVEVLQGVFDEIGRNGFRKIVIYNTHGGSNALLPYLAQCQLWEEKPYSLYIHQKHLTEEREAEWEALCETEERGHACECETSITLANYPEAVKMKDISAEPGTAQHRLKDLPPTMTGIGWYADYPEHYAGDAQTASVEKGEVFRSLLVDTLAEYIAAVKADSVVPTLTREFFQRADGLADSV
ncbi:MAG: creatininase family protein [Planctomycetota bacterium]|jgi:creatinine amidohydrolase